MSRRVFISYEYEKDQEFVNGLRGMLANPNVDIDFYNESIIESINSTNAGYIKSKIKEKISRASVLLCIVGLDTHTSEWVAWEIKTAVDLGKKVIFMRRKDNFRSSVPQVWLTYQGSRIFNSALQLANSKRKIYDWNIDFLKTL